MQKYDAQLRLDEQYLLEIIFAKICKDNLKYLLHV